MAASVLGKRSRRVIDADDIAPELPTSKRRTRRAPVSIYEDERASNNVQADAAKHAPCRPVQADSRLRRMRQRQSTQHKNATRRVSGQVIAENHVAEPEDAMDVENILPFEPETPTTLRYKDLFTAKLQSTPRRLVRVAGTCTKSKLSANIQPRSRPQGVFSAARQLFTTSSDPIKLVGRDSERQKIQQFISQAVESRNGGSVYVSGPPGTGKSALVHEVFQQFGQSEAVQISVVNCASLRTATDVYNKLLQDFAPDTKIGKLGLKHCLSQMFLNKSNDQLRLVLLDEIDNLIDTECEILYTLFEWAMHKSSSLALVGIANALDLTDRFLPRLKAKKLQPKLVPFLPYTSAQISSIISDKLRSLLPKDTIAANDFVPLMQPAAIQLCGKKIASQTGDLRKAFSLVRRVIDQVEKETASKSAASTPSKKPLGEILNLPSPPCTPTSKGQGDLLMEFTPVSAPRATIAHVAKTAASIFNNGTLSRLAGLNLQQKAVLCSLVAGETRKVERNPYITPSKSANKIPSIKDLFIKYSLLCGKDEGILQPLKDTEFRDVVASLETLGLVHEHRGRGSSLLTPSSTPSRAGRNSDDKQVVSAVSEKEMRESLTGAGADLLQRLLDEN